jgi:predicted acyl esterase
MLASDVQPMPANEYVPVTIPLYFEGHAYRTGSRVRVTVAAPNGTQPIWSFSHTQPAGTTATESVAFSPSMPSSIVLPIVPGLTIPTGLPACPSLRNEPCRPYQALPNNGS